MKPIFQAILIAAVALSSTDLSARPGDRVDRYPFPVCQVCVALDVAPVVAADAQGNFVVVWSKYWGYEGMEGVWARRYAADGAPLGDEFRVSPQGTTADDAAAVAMAPDGRFVVTWHQRYRPDGEAIVARRFAANGSAITGVLTVSPPGRWPEVPTKPDVAMDSSGNFVIVWHTYALAKDVRRAYGRSYDGTGAPRGPAFFVAGSGTEDSWVAPEVAMGDHDEFVVVWLQGVQDQLGTISIRGKRFDLLGHAIGTAFPVAASTAAGHPGSDIDVAADPTGAFTVAYPRWRNIATGSESVGVFARRFTAQAVARGAQFRVAAPGTTNFANEVDVDVDDDGDFVIVWIGQAPNYGNTNVHVRLYAANGAALTRDREYAYEETGPRESAVTMDANGDFIVAFHRSGPNPDDTGYSDNNFAQRFAGPDDRRASCAGIIAGVLGTSGNDTLRGTSGDDVIHGFGGNDVVYGGGGKDALCGADGDDQLFGEVGDDFLSGGNGDDVLDGGTERDACIGNAHVNADTALQCEQVTGVP
jgi:hypothetical protein